MSAGFINLGARSIDDAIEDGLRRIVALLDIDRITLIRMWRDTGRIEVTHSVACEGIELVSHSYPVPPQMPRALAMAMTGEPVVFSRLDDLPPEASVDRRAYEQLGVKSSVVMPIFVADEFHGALGFVTTRRERTWSDELLGRVHILADIFGNALARKHVQEELDHAREFEALATRILASLLLSETDDETDAIERGMREIGLFLEVERVTLWERLPGKSEFSKTSGWTAPGVPAPIDRFGVIEGPWICERLIANEIVRFARLAELPVAAAADLPALQGFGVRSLLLVPHSRDGQVVGAIGVSTLSREREWPAPLVSSLRLLAEVFASLNVRRSAERQKRAAEAEAAHWRERLAHLVRVHAVGEMSAALAHEITQPLGAIENYALAARRRSAEPSPNAAKVSDLLEKIINQTARAGDVVMRLRSMAKRHDLELKEIDLERAVGICVDMVRTDCELRDIRIELKATQRLPSVVADEIHIQQVVLNLLRNAMEATESRSPSRPKTITCTTRMAGPDSVSVQVADPGCGIAQGELDRVFESFYSSKPHGLGIGLAISRKLVEAHGGALWASHNPGGGAVFEFTLPVRSR
jgi:signal transduction histidine kinase